MAIKVHIIGGTRLSGLFAGGAFEVFNSVVGSQALVDAVDNNTDVVVLQYQAEVDGLKQFVGMILAELPECRIILIGQALSDEKVLEFIIAGCCGYLEYAVLEEFLVKAIGAVYDGEAWISRKMVAHLIEVLRG